MKPWRSPDTFRRHCYFYNRRTHAIARVSYLKRSEFAAANPDWEMYSFKYIAAKEQVPYCMCELWCWWVWKKGQDVNGFECELFDRQEYERVLREER